MPQPPYNAEMKNLQKDPLDLNGIHLGSRRVSQKRDSPDFIKEQHPKEEYIEESCTTFDGEQPLEPEIDFLLLLCLSSFPLCV